MKKFFCFICLCLAMAGYSQRVVKNVDAPTFKKLVDEQKAILIDLRTDDEIAKKGMIKGAMQIDFLSPGAEAAIDNLDHNQPCLIYCAGGGRSGECAELMEKHGFKDVTNLEKGFSAWTAKGYEVTRRQQ